MALQNLSLAHNPVSFYQTAKLLTVPMTVAMECLLGTPHPRSSRVFGLLLITCGMFLCTGLASTIATAAVLVSTAWLQRTAGLSSTQLLHSVAGLDGVLLSTFGPLCDYHLSGRVAYTSYDWLSTSSAIVGATCMLAVIVNCATFFLLGKISPTSYQVISQLKTALTYITGYYFFDKSLDRASTLGILSAVIGRLLYTYGYSESDHR